MRPDMERSDHLCFGSEKINNWADAEQSWIMATISGHGPNAARLQARIVLFGIFQAFIVSPKTK